MPTASRAKGFTLIELVITVAIVGVLAWLAVPLMEMSAQRQKEAELRTALRQIREAIDAYHGIVVEQRKTNKIRIDVPADASDYPPNLETLANGVTDRQSPEGRKIYFLRRLPRDPMNPDGELPAADTWGKRSYASPPDAPSEGEDVFDVYSRSEAVGLNGVPYKEW
ncbi:MAG: type II secretion system protein [Hydrogenophilaceae bacterium]|nr:type II secretion system protein [Hydrogenophilaceae bacterium]